MTCICGAPTAQRCSRCQSAHYCSRSCQKRDWKVHQKRCTISTPLPTPLSLLSYQFLEFDQFLKLSCGTSSPEAQTVLDTHRRWRGEPAQLTFHNPGDTIEDTKQLIVLEHFQDITIYIAKNKLEHVFIVAGTDITTISDDFLASCNTLCSVTLVMPSLTSVGDCWLAGCTALKQISITAPQLTSVQECWLAGCGALTEVSFALPSLTSVGRGWLEGCRALTEVSFTLPSLTSVGANWQRCCAALKKVSFALPSLTSVKGNWLRSCATLEEITITLPLLISVGAYWLANCDNLKETNYNLPELTVVGDNWLWASDALERVTFVDSKMLEAINEARFGT